MGKDNFSSVVMVAAAVVLSAFGAQAQTLTTDTLAALDDGASLTIGDKTFSNFTSSSEPSSPGFDPTVTASVIGNVDYLTWTSASIFAPANSLTDVSISYTVTASAGLITEMDQEVTGDAFGGTGDYSVSDTVIDANTLGTVATISVSSPALDSDASFSGRTGLNVEQDILLVGGSTGANISQLQESFQQSPASAPDSGTTLVLLSGVMTAMTLLRAKAGKLE